MRLTRHVGLVEDGASGTFVLDERRVWRVHHPLARAVLAALVEAGNGLEVESIHAAVAGLRPAPDDVELALRELRAIGAVTDDAPMLDIPTRDSQTTDEHPSSTGHGNLLGRQRPPASGVRTVLLTDAGAGQSPLRGLARTLTGQGIHASLEPPAADDPVTGVGSSPSATPGLTVLVTRDFLTAGLVERVRTALRTGVSAVVLRLSGRSAAVSPVYRPAPATSPCPACVHHQLERNVEPTAARARELASSSGRRLRRPPEISQAVLSGAAALISQLPHRTISLDDAPAQPPPARPNGARPARPGSPVTAELVVWHTDSVTLTRHPVVRRPHCRDCGEPALLIARFAHPPVPARRAVLPGPGYRSSTAADLLARTGHLFDPVTGLLSEVTDLGAVAGTRLLRGRHPVAPEGSGWRRAIALGRGSTDEEARAALLGEAVERYCCAWHGDEPTILASQDALGGLAVPPASLSLFSAAQVARRLTDVEVVPARLPADAPINWTPVSTFPGGEQRFLPASSLFFGHTDPGPAPYALPDSNGCAAGSSIEEAMVVALLELIERDAVGIWWYSMARRPEVTDAATCALRDAAARDLAASGRDLWVLDLTTDLGVPVVAAVSTRGGHQVVFGFGAHLDHARAASRAIGELAQLLAIGPDAQQPGHRLPHTAADRFWSEVRLTDLPHLEPDPAAQATPVMVGPSGDLLADVLAVTGRLRRTGLDVLALDLSRPDVDLSVVRVVVPGLRHFWPRLAPGRLYDIPEQLGWLNRPLTEEECNPVALFV